MPGPIKDQTVNERWVPSWPVNIFERVTLSLIGVAFVTYPVWKWPEDKCSSEVSLCEEFLVSVNQIMLTETETEQIAAVFRSNVNKYIVRGVALINRRERNSSSIEHRVLTHLC